MVIDEPDASRHEVRCLLCHQSQERKNPNASVRMFAELNQICGLQLG